jgi:NADPH-dependent ferric siderophore reductase
MKTKKIKAKKATKPTKQKQVRFKTPRSPIAEGTRLYTLAGRPNKTDFVKVYGPKGPAMTWAQRAKAGVNGKHFQEALKAKS